MVLLLNWASLQQCFTRMPSKLSAATAQLLSSRGPTVILCQTVAATWRSAEYLAKVPEADWRVLKTGLLLIVLQATSWGLHVVLPSCLSKGSAFTTQAFLR
jgi:hypothetical protein